MIRRPADALFALVFVFTAAACDPSMKDALAAHRPNGETFRGVLLGVADAVDRAPPPPESKHCKPGKILGYSPLGDGHDTEIYVYEDLRRGGAPTKPEERPKIDLSQATPMHTLLADTHPSRTWTPAELAEKRPEKVAAYRRTVGVKNVIVLKQRVHERDRGALVLDVFVVQLNGMKVLCGGSVTARAPADLGTRAYDVVGTDDAGVRRVLASGQTDLYWDRMKFDAYKKLEERFRVDFAIDLPKP